MDTSRQPTPTDLGLLFAPTEQFEQGMEALRKRKSDDLEFSRRVQKQAADLDAMYKRFHRRDSGEAMQEEELIRGARAWAFLQPASSEQARREITRTIRQDPSVPNDLKTSAESIFGLQHFDRLHNAIWREGYPCLEDLAIQQHQMRAQKIC